MSHPVHVVNGEPAADNLSPLLIDIKGLAQLLNRSVPSLFRDDAAGRLPAGLKIGASKRWRYAEINAWVEAGCPSRRDWDAMNDRKGVNGKQR